VCIAAQYHKPGLMMTSTSRPVSSVAQQGHQATALSFATEIQCQLKWCVQKLRLTFFAPPTTSRGIGKGSCAKAARMIKALREVK
jgi:hypothetical protein